MMNFASSPTRSTSIQVTRATTTVGRHIAEDMHGFECFIDANSAVETEVSPGMILQADIDPSGHVVRGYRQGFAQN